MLWSPAYIQGLGLQPSTDAQLPALASPVQALDTSDPSRLFADTAGSVAITDGALVARANDAGGGTNSFQQADSTKRPTYVAGVRGGKGSLRFGGSRYLALAGVANPGTLFQGMSFTMALAYVRFSAGAKAGLFVAGNSSGGQNNLGCDQVLVEGSEDGWPQVFRNGGSTANWSRVPMNNPAYADNDLQKVVIRSSPAAGIDIRVKSKSGNYDGHGGVPTDADSFTWDAALIGATFNWPDTPSPSSFLIGDFFEFRFWASRAADADFAQLQAYLDNKWGK